MKVKTRFAPSPTGYLHIGGLRTALYAWLFARKNNGSFVLRIEDTDRERLVDGACRVIYDTMRDAGLYYDEGPDVGGESGPYIQSERKDIYKKYAEELVERGAAYYCFCTKERLDRLHAEAKDGNIAKYDKHCLKLPKEDADARTAAGEPYVIRQNIPDEGETAYTDMVFGEITVPNSDMEDNILLKSDGYPTYNLANVVDDHLMGITHVMRGMEYLSSTPKYNLLYDALGWERPAYIHMPPVMKDKHSKLSKRNGDASYDDFIKKGYLKEAIINYIALLGWSPSDNREIFSLDELAEAFTLEGLSKSPAIFDTEKLTWMNAEYIRAMPAEQFESIARPFMAQSIDVDRFDTMFIARLIQPRTEVLTEIPEKLSFLENMPEYSLELYFHKKMKASAETAPPMLEAARKAMASLDSFDEQALHDTLIKLAGDLEVKNGQLLWPLRVALSGTSVTPGGAIEIALLLGRDESLARIDAALSKLKAELG